MTELMILASHGVPAESSESVTTEMHRKSCKYGPIGGGRFKLVVHFENGLVAGWERT